VQSVQIERNFTQFVVFSEDSLLTALNKITANQCRLIFVVSEGGILQGVLSDGDFRRWIAATDVIDLNRPVTAAMNPHCISAAEGSTASDLAGLLSPKIQVIPLLDDHGRVVAVARGGQRRLLLGDRAIGDGAPAFVIAEIGNNHNGSLDLALQLIDAAAARWPVAAVRIHHRLGCVMAGEVSLWIEVTAPHRGEAFAACQWIIDEMKRVVPIWKRALPRPSADSGPKP
jgi:N-acetylneuraminate synthase